MTSLLEDSLDISKSVFIISFFVTYLLLSSPPFKLLLFHTFAITLKKIIKLKTYDNFEKAIRDAKLKNILPGIKTYAEGVKVYHGIPGFKDKSKKFGVLNIFLD